MTSTSENWIAKRRDEIGLSQEELARRLQSSGFNISRATLSNWENEKVTTPLHDPDFRTAFADALEVSRRKLLELAGYEVTGTRYSELTERAADLIDDLPPSQQAFVLNFINWYTQQEQARFTKDGR